MIIKCGVCGNDMELPGDIADGQRVSCPFCGDKTIYSKPTRIEIPVGVSSAGRRRRPEPTQDPESLPHDERKPKLGIRRPKDSSSATDLNAQAIMKKMEDEEHEKAVAAERAAMAMKKLRREMIVRYSVIAAVVAVCAVAACFWFMKRHAERMEKAAEIRERIRVEQEAEKLRDEQEKAERIRLEEQRKAEREARRRQEEDERRLKTEAAEKRRLEEDARRKSRQMAVERYQDSKAKFRNAVLLPYRMLPKGSRPGAVEGVFDFAVPVANGDYELYEVASHTGSVLTATMLSARGEPVSVDYPVFEERVKCFGGIVHNGQAAYLICPVDGGKGMPLPTSDFSPARMRTGGLHGTVASLFMATDRLFFEIRVELPGWKRPVFVKSVAYGDMVSIAEVESALRDAASGSVSKPRTHKAKRRTVELYDGDIIKRQMGVTLVPRNPRYHNAKWQALYDEAIRQERESNEGPTPVEIEKYQEAVARKYHQYRTEATLAIGIKDTAR